MGRVGYTANWQWGELTVNHLIKYSTFSATLLLCCSDRIEYTSEDIRCFVQGILKKERKKLRKIIMGLTKWRWARESVDWPIIRPVSVIQTTASSLPVPSLDVGKCLLFCTKASVDYCHTQTKTRHICLIKCNENVQNLNVCWNNWPTGHREWANGPWLSHALTGHSL